MTHADAEAQAEVREMHRVASAQAHKIYYMLLANELSPKGRSDAAKAVAACGLFINELAETLYENNNPIVHQMTVLSITFGALVALIEPTFQPDRAKLAKARGLD